MENHAFTIHAQKEYFKIDTQGRIARECMNWKPSRQWLAVALVRYNNNGTIKENIPFSQWPERKAHIQETRAFKNGKPQWHLVDLDHGTRRIWGNPINQFYHINA